MNANKRRCELRLIDLNQRFQTFVISIDSNLKMQKMNVNENK